MAKTLSVNIVLDCNHKAKETIEVVILQPCAGDLRICQKCINSKSKAKKKMAYRRRIARVGIPFWEDLDTIGTNKDQMNFLEEIEGL